MLYEVDVDTYGIFELVLWPAVESEADRQEFELEPLPLGDVGFPV